MKLLVRPSDPLIADRWLDVAYVIYWFIFGGWGITSIILGLPTVQMLTTDWYQTAWSGGIGALATLAGALALLVFFDTPRFKQISKKRAEQATVWVLGVFILIYPVLLIVRAGDGQQNRVGAAAVLALSYLVFPALRIHLLRGRIKRMLAAVSDAS